MRNSWKAFLLIPLSVCAWLSLSGYVISTLTDFSLLAWNPGSFPIRIQIWEGFTDRLPSVVDGSHPKLAIREALESWTRVSTLTATLGPDTSTENVGKDGVNLVTLANTLDNRNIVGSLSAVSLFWFEINDAKLFEADVIFNPAVSWSTLESSSETSENLFDVALHEFGHGFNLSHSISRSSSMYFRGGSFDFGFNQLSWDDVAGINVKYPLIGIDQITGSISGRVSRSGGSVFGAFVVAVDDQGVQVASTITHPDGTYKLDFLPPGKYTLYVEPLDGPMTAAHLFGGTSSIFSSAPVTSDFLPKFYNDSAQPLVTVLAGKPTPGVDFAVTRGNSQVDPEFLGKTADPNGGFSVFTIPTDVAQGSTSHLVVAGTGVDTLAEDKGVYFLGSHLATGRSSGSGQLPGSRPYRSFPLTVAAAAPEGDYSIFLQSPRGLGVISGGVQLFSPFRFLQAFAQFTHSPGTASSELFLINTSTQKAASGKISTHAAMGNAGSVTFSSLANGSDGDWDFLLDPGGSLFARTSGGDTFRGSLRAEGDRSLAGTVLFETASGTTGVGPSRPLYSFIAPVAVEDGGSRTDTGLAIANLEERPAHLYIQVQDRAGRIIARKVVPETIPANGQIAGFLRDLVPTVPDDFEGTVVVTANRKIGATVIRTSPGVFTTFPVVGNRSSTRSYYAQFVHAGDLSSELLLVNPSPHRTASAQVTVRNSAGQLASVRLNTETLAEGKKTVSVPPLGCVALRTSGSSLLIGSVEVSSEIPVGGVVLFRSSSAGTTGVGESFPMSRMVVPVDRNLSAGTDTGLAVTNTEERNVTLKLTVRDARGVIVREGREFVLPARAQLSKFPNEAPLNLNLDGAFRGTLWIEATGQVALTVIRQSPGVLTTFPAVSLERAVTPRD